MVPDRASQAASQVASQVAARLALLVERAAGVQLHNDAVARDAILAARARVLAQPRVQHDAAADADMLGTLVFLVGEERLAMPLAAIVAIIRAGAVTPLPRAVAPVFGVTAWRGRPLTVLSIGTQQPSAAAHRRLIVLGDERRAAVGLLADAVDETRIVAQSKLSAAPKGPRSTFALGMTDDAVLVLDATALINATRPES